MTLPRLSGAEPDSSVRARADAHFRRGVELAKGGDFGAAALEFETAQGLSPHPTVLFNLGQAYARSGQPVRALRALEEYLKTGTAASDSTRRRQAEDLMVSTRARIGWLKLELSTPDVRVLIDGQEEAPLADGRIMLPAGGHSLVAYAPGHEVLVREFSIEPRSTLELDARLVPHETDARGLLRIACATPDVVVTLDGERLGTTPISEPVLATVGAHRVTFRRAGYAALAVDVEVRAEARASVACKLIPDAAGLATGGRIAVAGGDGSEIFVDGARYHGELLPAGRHSVSFADPSLAPRLVRVESGKAALIDSPFTGRVDDWRLGWSYGLAVAGGALLVAGATTYLVNTSRHDAWEQRHADWSSSIPREEDAAWLAEGVALDRDRAELQRMDLAAAAFAAAGVGAAVTGLALWWTSPEKEPALHVRVTGESVGLTGSW